MSSCGFFWPSESAWDQGNAQFFLQGNARGEGRWSPNSTVEVCSSLDCHTEIHCHLELFLGPSVFNLMVVLDLSEVPVYGLHLHPISLAGWARLFPIEVYLCLGS